MKDITKLQRASILSILVGVGFILLIIANGNIVLTIIGWIFCFVGGWNFGNVIRLMKK